MWEGARRRRHLLLRGQGAGQSENEDDGQESAQKHADSEDDWNQSLVTVRPPNALPLLFEAEAKA
ncbi:hypothetical protein GCM10020255_090550 [Rhodococcus baikonurensis]